MELENGSEIWESEDRDMKIEQFINLFAENLKKISKTSKESYITEVLRKVFEVKKILGDSYE